MNKLNLVIFGILVSLVPIVAHSESGGNDILRGYATPKPSSNVGVTEAECNAKNGTWDISFDQVTGTCTPGDPNNSKNSQASAADNSDTGSGKADGNCAQDGDPCCDSFNNAKMACKLGMGDGDQAMIMQGLQQGAGAATMGAGAKSQCDTAAKASELLGAINGAQGAACTTAEVMCVNACDETLGKVGSKGTAPDTNKAKIANAYKSKCHAYRADIARMATQVIQSFGAMKGAMACSEALKQVPVAVPAPTTPHLVMPNPIVGNTDCSNPAMASTSQCLCVANPSSPLCGGTPGGGTGGPGGLSKNNSPGGTSGKYGGTSALTDGSMPPGGPTGPGGPSNNKPGSEIPQGGGGGFGGDLKGGGAAAAAASDDPGAAGAQGLKTDIIGGVTGAGGSYSYGRGGGTPAGDAQSKYLKALRDKFNLSKFLPGKGAQRGLAGMAGQNKDGITGAMGPSIWQKVSNQYDQQKPSLILGDK